MTRDEMSAAVARLQTYCDSMASRARRDDEARDEARAKEMCDLATDVLYAIRAPAREEPTSAADVLFLLGESAGPGQEPTPEMAREIWALMEGETRFTIAVRAWERGRAVTALRAPVAPDEVVAALEAMTDDIEARWDMHDPSTNPGIRDNVERARNALAALRAPVAPASHRCSGCGHRWDEPMVGAELCGDCWRKAQPALHGPPMWEDYQCAIGHKPIRYRLSDFPSCPLCAPVAGYGARKDSSRG